MCIDKKNSTNNNIKISKTENLLDSTQNNILKYVLIKYNYVDDYSFGFYKAFSTETL